MSTQAFDIEKLSLYSPREIFVAVGLYRKLESLGYSIDDLISWVHETKTFDIKTLDRSVAELPKKKGKENTGSTEEIANQIRRRRAPSPGSYKRRAKHG